MALKKKKSSPPSDMKEENDVFNGVWIQTVLHLVMKLQENSSIVAILTSYVYIRTESCTDTSVIPEPRHDKMRLWEFPTTPDTNRPVQPQKLARVLKFRL